MRKIIQGSVILDNLHLTELFVVDLLDVEVQGDFSCDKNNLTNLEGSPHWVGNAFACQFTGLTSLKGAPKSINGSFNCSNNNLPNLEGSPHTVGIDFVCYNNPLTSLDGIPTSIGGGFHISYIFKDKFPEEYINSLSKIKRGVFYH